MDKKDKSLLYRGAWRGSIEIFLKMYLVYFLAFIGIVRMAGEAQYENANRTLYVLLGENRIIVFLVVFLFSFISIIWYEIMNFIIDNERKIGMVLKGLLWIFIGIFLWKKMGISLQKLILGNIKNVSDDVWLSGYILYPDNLWRVIGSVYAFSLILKYAKRWFKNKSAANIAFVLDVVYSAYAMIGTIIYFNFPFSNWTEMSAGEILAIFAMTPLLFFIFLCIRYISYASVMERKDVDNPIEITIVLLRIPGILSINNSLWSLEISREIVSYLKNSNFSVSVLYIDEITDKCDWANNIIIFTGFYRANINYYVELAEKHSAFLIYEHIYDTFLNANISQIRDAYYKQVDSRKFSYLESSIGNVLKKVVSNAKQIDFRKKMDELMFSNIDWSQLDDTVFSDVLTRGINDMYSRMDTFSLADCLIKYIESLNHCITLILFNMINISVTDIMKNGRTKESLKQGTFGEWRSMRKAILECYENSMINLLLWRYRKVLERNVDSYIASDMNTLLRELMMEEIVDISNEELLGNMVIFRNYTRGHGVYTYHFNETLVFSLTKIAVYITNILGELWRLYPVNRLETLGWLYCYEEDNYFLNSCLENKLGVENTFIEYYSGRIISTDAEKN